MVSTPAFTESDIYRFEDKGQMVIALGMLLGWTVRWQNSNRKVAVISLGGRRINIPSTNLNAKRSESMLRQVLRHSPAEQLSDLLAGRMVLSDYSPRFQGIIARVGVAGAVADAEAAAAELAKREEPVQMELPTTEPEPEPTDSGDEPKPPTVVKVTPYIARLNQTHQYESGTIEVIGWSNGTTTYRCRICRKFEGLSARSVSNHAKWAHPGEGLEERNRVIASQGTRKKRAPEPEPVEPEGIEVEPDVNAPIDFDQFADSLLSLPFEQRAQLARTLLNGRDPQADERIAEVERQRDEAIRQREKVEADLRVIRDLLPN